MKTVFSGIQPTGNLHLGNYLGSIRNWIDLQNSHACIFGIMNLHAITLPQDPKELQQNILDAAAVYLACGLDPKKSTIFVQGEVAEHAELAWVLGTMTPMGWLNRMTQFKDKTKTKTAEDVIREVGNDIVMKYASELIASNVEQKPNSVAQKISNEINEKIFENELRKNSVFKLDSSNLGLYSYPVLMASDILLYKADLVPVGEDQKQHLELTRDIAGAFNRRYKKEYFKLPEPMILKTVKRIMSLQDGSKKMSKSEESDLSRINLNDDADLIMKKVKKAKTDSLSTITYDENRFEIYNLLNIFSAFSGKDPQSLAQEYETSGNGKFKNDLAEVLIEKLRPIQEKLNHLNQDQSYIKQVLNDGKIRAQDIASKVKKEVFEIVGL